MLPAYLSTWQEQRRLVEERFSLPKYWAAKLLGPSVSQSDDVSFVPVIDDQTLGALQACILIDNLDWIGWGRDQACPAQHSGLEVVTAWRVEHQAQWMKYRAEQSKMRADLKLSNVKLQPVEVKKPLSTTSKDLPGELDEAVNEVFLLHGTDPTKVLQIAREGLNERFSSRSCFGFGSYMAEDAGKVDQYIKPDEFHHWRNKTLHDKLYVHRRHPGMALESLLVDWKQIGAPMQYGSCYVFFLKSKWLHFFVILSWSATTMSRPMFLHLCMSLKSWTCCSHT